MKTLSRKLPAVLLAAAFCFGSAFTAAPVSALGETGHVKIIKFPASAEPNKEYWGAAEMSFANGWNHFATQNTTLRNAVEKDRVGYCIEPGSSQHSVDEFVQEGELYWDNYIPRNGGLLSGGEVKEMIGRLMYYGFQEKIHTNWTAANNGDKIAYAYATQLLIWEVIIGERDVNFSHVGNKATHNTPPPQWTKAAAMSADDIPIFESKTAVGGNIGASSVHPVYDMVYSRHPLYSQIDAYYNQIEANMQNHCELPSFMTRYSADADSYELTKNGDCYEITLTDTNNKLNEFTFACSDSSLHFSVNGNKLTIRSYTPVTDLTLITAERKASQRCGVLTWSAEEPQDMVTYVQEVSDPVQGYLQVWSQARGSLKIIKISENGKVAGIKFRVKGSNVNITVTTGADGTAYVSDLLPGIYTVTEIVPDGYIPQEPQTVIVNAD